MDANERFRIALADAARRADLAYGDAWKQRRSCEGLAEAASKIDSAFLRERLEPMFKEVLKEALDVENKAYNVMAKVFASARLMGLKPKLKRKR